MYTNGFQVDDYDDPIIPKKSSIRCIQSNICLLLLSLMMLITGIGSCIRYYQIIYSDHYKCLVTNSTLQVSTDEQYFLFWKITFTNKINLNLENGTIQESSDFLPSVRKRLENYKIGFSYDCVRENAYENLFRWQNLHLDQGIIFIIIVCFLLFLVLFIVFIILVIKRKYLF